MKRFLTLALVVGFLAAIAVTRANEPDGQGAGSPIIVTHGKVTPFPDATAQPRSGSKVLVDLTAGGPRDSLNPGIEKLARFLNIYAAAGESPARVQIAVVLHGDATQVALNHAAYAKAFGTGQNPNLTLIHKLREAGVEIEVCGQALTNKGFQPDQVAPEIELAVSGLTAMVNRQQDGYAYIPLFK